ncbi:hypothetical protein F4861DRAFT_550565 [Xylaria intraflava]|nr:hypothetical protein F4861DRAFT_550565 [Xylaria intraflava]
MPVTELAWIRSATPGSVPPALITAAREGMEAQSLWAETYAVATLPPGPPAVRGAALFRQLEDAGVMLITAHWDSKAQHAECIASRENREAMAAVVPLIAPEGGVVIRHVDGVSMFGADTLGAGFLSIVRIGARVGSEGDARGRVEGVWGRVTGLLSEASGFEHSAGWRVEKSEVEGREEFVVVGGWRDEEALKGFTGGEVRRAWDEAWRDVVMDVEVTTYRRID